MRLKTKIAVAAVLAVLASAALYGCVLDGKNTQEAGNVPQGESQPLYFWYSDDSLTNFIGSAAVAFGEREGIYVIPVLVEEQEYLEAINQASLYSAQMPDAYIISHDSLEKAYLAGLAAPVLDEGGICSEEHFPQAALSAVSYQGRIVGYPLFFETCALLYNATYLEEWAVQAAGEGIVDAASVESIRVVPSTVEDILTIANTFDAPQDVESIMRWDVGDILYNYWIVGGCMDVGGECGDDPRSININNPEALACLEVYKELGQVFSMEPEEVRYDSTIRDFCEGRIVFTIASTDVVKTLAERRERGEIGFEYGIALLPQVRDGLPSRPLSVTNAVVVNGYSKQLESANRFAAYLAEECADSLYTRTGKASANKMADADNSLMLIFKEEYAVSVPLPKMMTAGNFWLQMEGIFLKLWEGGDEAELLWELSEQMKTQTAPQSK